MFGQTEEVQNIYGGIMLKLNQELVIQPSGKIKKYIKEDGLKTAILFLLKELEN